MLWLPPFRDVSLERPSAYFAQLCILSSGHYPTDAKDDAGAVGAAR